MHNQPDDLSLRALEHEANYEYNVAQKNYTQLLEQKAKIRWLQEGDDNIKTFHQSIKMRRIQNRINTIRKGDGSWAHNSSEVVTTFLEFYQQFLGSCGTTKKVESSIIARGQVLT